MIGLVIFGTFIGHFFAKKGVRMIAGIIVLIMAIYYLGWIAPQDKVTKRATMVSQQTEKIRAGEQSPTQILEQLQNSGHGHSAPPSNAHNMMPSDPHSMNSNNHECLYRYHIISFT